MKPKFKSGQEIVLKIIEMAQGNRIAWLVLSALAKEPDGINKLILLDGLGIHGEKIVFLWQKQSDRDLIKFKKNIEAIVLNKSPQIDYKINEIDETPYISAINYPELPDKKRFRN